MISLVPRDVLLPRNLRPATPAPGCRGAEWTTLSISESTGQRDTAWRWIKGQATNAAEFGDPTTSARYALCIYDGTGLALELDEIGWSCWKKGKKRTCWKFAGTRGFRYRHVGLDRQRILLIGSDENTAEVEVTNRGAAVTAPALPMVAPVTVQWQTTRTDFCWEATYTSVDITENTTARFKAQTRN